MIVPIALALLLVGIFVAALRVLRIDRSAVVAWRECTATSQVLRSNASDLEKERAARGAALSLARLMVTILFRLALAALLPLALIYVFDATGIATTAALEAALLSTPVIIAGVVFALIALLVR